MAFLALELLVGRAAALDRVVIKRENRSRQLVGRITVEAEDGGLLFQTRDGILWTVQPDEIVRRDADDEPFQAFDADEMAAQLLEEMPGGFKVHKTANYVVCYNTTDAYAQWCGGLYERLFRAFNNYWKNRGLKLTEPEFPLVALVFDDHASYARYATPELGAGADSIIGYYNVRTNRVMMYDLTGIESLSRGQRVRSTKHINQILSQPGAERTVATIVHEATHQLAYNSGMQTRFAANPFWISEGLAIYFETPDLRSSRGWSNIGGVNKYNLAQFRFYLPNRPSDSLVTLIADDKRFRDPKQAPAAYAESWALNYYLIRKQQRNYVRYVQQMAEQQPLEELSADERIKRFQAAFGADLRDLDEDFLRYMRNVRS